jgi:hypothetical protein
MLNAYPVINYDNHNIIDISKRFIVTNIDSEHSKNIYFWHTIKNWKSPENIAYDFYGSCDYVWIIISLNNIINPFEDWLLSDEEIKQRIQNKWGSNMGDVHHYEQNGLYYQPSIKLSDLNVADGPITTITNYEYEIIENEKKRTIKVLYPHLLSTIEHEAKALFR